MDTLIYRIAAVLKCRAREPEVIKAAAAAMGTQGALDALARMFGTSDPEQLVKAAEQCVKDRDAMKATIDNLSQAIGVLKKPEVEMDAHPAEPGETRPEKAAVVASRRAKVQTLAGRNPTEQAMTLLSAQRPGFATMDRLDQVKQAGAWLRGEGPDASPADPALARTEAKLLQLRDMPGRNDTERAMSLLTKQRPGFAGLDRLEQVRQASEFLRAED